MSNEIRLKINIMEVFNEIASSYAYSRIRPWPQVMKLIHRYYNGGIICDIGCGPGQYSITIAIDKKCTLISIDIAPSMLEILWKRAVKREAYQNIHIIQADMEHIPLRDKSVSMVLHIATIHHLPSMKCRINALREVYRILRNKGILIATVWALIQPKFIIHLLKNIALKVIGKVKSIGDVIVPWRHKGKVLYRYYHLFLPRELRKLIITVGFKVLEHGELKIRTKIVPDNYYVVGVKE